MHHFCTSGTFNFSIQYYIALGGKYDDETLFYRI